MSPEDAVAAFTAALNARDVEGALALVTDDVVFESTAPPDGQRFTGKAALAAEVTAMLDQTPSLRFDIEETIVSGDRVITCWRYDFGTGHVRGVDVNRVRDGLIAETRAYVKG